MTSGLYTAIYMFVLQNDGICTLQNIVVLRLAKDVCQNIHHFLKIIILVQCLFLTPITIVTFISNSRHCSWFCI